MKECKISKYLSVKQVLGAKNFKRNKMIQNGTDKNYTYKECNYRYITLIKNVTTATLHLLRV